ncbi:uncharacterized protein LOC114360908 isoform X2 [Ostrinia furnacalis]|uniref:uncharacterized protein LOC114360908 isoform X2 n=1 Tax=Ostrinia furnacalis TaxID=93504 RepID=UPI001038CB5F|nr:uncharacterized protein LOC114360908 isoform X2 [Ostrinia furnacalis]
MNSVNSSVAQSQPKNAHTPRSQQSLQSPCRKMDVQTAAAVAMCTLAYYNYVKCLTAERQKDKQKENTILINDEDGDEDEQRETERDFTGKIIKKKQKKGRCWMIPLHRDRTRHTMEQQFRELMGQSGGFENFVRMSMADFCLLLSEIEPMISKQDTRFREAIPAKIRLAITLRYLATDAEQ